MQEESTRIINDAPVSEKSQVSNTESKKENVVNSKKGAEVNGNIVYGGAGFVAGMAAGRHTALYEGWRLRSQRPFPLSLCIQKITEIMDEY